MTYRELKAIFLRSRGAQQEGRHRRAYRRLYRFRSRELYLAVFRSFENLRRELIQQGIYSRYGRLFDIRIRD